MSGDERPYPTQAQMEAVRAVLMENVKGSVSVGGNAYVAAHSREHFTSLAWKVLRAAREAGEVSHA